MNATQIPPDNQYPIIFNIGGQEVCVLSPVVTRLTINVPWSCSHEPTLNEKKFVMRTTESIVRYMENEGLITHPGVGLMVMTKHPQP